MPYMMRKGKSGYSVTSPSGTKGSGMTLRNARRQMNLLRGIEHGWKPTGKPESKGASYFKKRKKKKKRMSSDSPGRAVGRGFAPVEPRGDLSIY